VKEAELIKYVKKALESCFNPVQPVQIHQMETESTDSGTDFILKIETPLGEKTIFAELFANGQPRYARLLIDRRLQLSKSSDSYYVFIAPFITGKTGELLKKHDIGYLDFAGNCFISFDGIHIEKEGNKNPFLTKRILGSLYQAKASRVLRVLLSSPKEQWRLGRLAQKAEVSLGHAYNVKRELIDREWAIAKPDGLKLTEPAELLKDWVKHYRYERNTIYSFYSLQNPFSLERSLNDICKKLDIQYALSDFAGAARIAPFVRYHRVSSYLAGSVGEIARRLDLKKVTSGENISLMIPYDSGVFYDYRIIQDIHIASPLQLYLDLKRSSWRGTEAAELIYEKEISAKW